MARPGMPPRLEGELFPRDTCRAERHFVRREKQDIGGGGHAVRYVVALSGLRPNHLQYGYPEGHLFEFVCGIQRDFIRRGSGLFEDVRNRLQEVSRSAWQCHAYDLINRISSYFEERFY